MKNTHKWAKRLLMIFASSAAFFSAERVMAQSTCGSATPLTVNGCNNNITTSDTVFWFSFNSGTAATWSSMRISRDTSSTGMTGIQLYSGSCGSLSLVQTGYYDMSALILETNVSPSTNYYVKVKRTQTSSISFNACLRITTVVPCAPCTTGNCQLVCNPSMELYALSTLTLLGQFANNVCNWTKPVMGTPDYFNSTTTVPAIDVPLNCYGTENPHTGIGYAGGYLYYNNPSGSVTSDTNFREYIQTQLVQPLTANLTYRVSFWVSLSDYSGYALGHIGAYLSTTQPIQNSAQDVLNFTPQISHSTAVTTINGWTLITNTFTPTQSGIQWVTIGSFETDAQQQTLRQSVTWTGNDLSSGGNPNWGAYYYIDDVKVDPEYPIALTYSPNPLCYGIGSFNITATTPLSNGNYTWTNPAGVNWACTNASCSTITVTPLYNYNATYSVSTIIPSYGNCTATGTITPTWNNSPTAVSAGSDQTICLGGSATLLGTGTGAYDVTTWSIPNISTICSGCTTTVVSPTVNTNYVYTLTNSYTGCSLRDTVKITVVPLAVTIVSPPGANMCAGCYNFTTSPVGASYSWSCPNSTTTSCPTCATFTACWNGHPYDTANNPVFVTVSIVDANGCQGSAFTTIPTCCPFKEGQEGSYANIGNETIGHVDSVSFPALFSPNAGYLESVGGQFSINGILTINKNTRLKGCEVKLGPNAKIVVSPGIVFELTNNGTTRTMLYACSDMWDGIYVDGTNTNSQVNVLNGTIIEDAKNAIVSSNGGKFSVQGTANMQCRFNKNNIGIWIKPFAGTHPGVIRYAMFSCDAPNQPGGTPTITLPGSNCRAPISGIGFAGIYVETCNAVTIGDSTSASFRNDFQRTQYGIYSKGSNVKVWNNNFKYFTNTIVNKSLAPNGIAVYATAGKFNAKYLTVGRQGNYKAKNKFTKCSYGVFAQNYMNLNCEFNRFDSCMSAGITTMNCQSRTILINADTLTECTGTNIQCIQSSGSTVTITYNSINNTGPYVPGNFGNTGIYVAQAALTPVNLKIQFNSIKKMRNGIWVSRVDKCRITDNTPINFMTGQPMSQLVPCIGIKLEEVTNSMIRQNGVAMQTSPTLAVHDEIFGIHMTNCKNDTVTKNTFSRMGSAIFLKGANNPCILACNTMTTCWFGINFNFLNTNGVAVSVNDQITWTAANTPYATGNTWGGGSLGSDLKGRIMPIALNGIKWYYPSAGYNPTISMFLGSLFGNVTTSTTNGDRCSFMLAPPAQTPAGIRDNTLGGICKTPRTYDTLNAEYQYHDKVYAYRMLRDNPSWKSLGTADDSYYANFYTTHSSGNIGKFADVEDYISAGNVTSATSTLATITPSGQYEINRKAMLGVYLQTWAIDDMYLDSAQEVVLLAIVNQGTLVGGTSVFDARNMLRLEVHDSSTVRMENPIYSASAPNIVSPAYPNPSNGQVSIDVVLPQDVPAVFELFDLSGRLVGAWRFIGGQGKYTFDASFVPSGTYIYRVRTEGEILKSDRLIIIKE